jgi:predicted nucleic acid-binding protein
VGRFTAFLDANVLYPAELRSFLMHLALAGSFRPLWSAGVHEEWILAVLRTRPDLKREQLERTRALMDSHAADALVTGYEDLIPGLCLPDPKDRHVLAAAIRGRADLIVTMNLRDFPAEVIWAYGIEAQHPDEFLLRLLEFTPDAVLAAASTHRLSLKNPPKTVMEYLDSLERNGLPLVAAELRGLETDSRRG